MKNPNGLGEEDGEGKLCPGEPDCVGGECKLEPVDELETYLRFIYFLNNLAHPPKDATGAICIFHNDVSSYLRISWFNMSERDIVATLEKVKSDFLTGKIEAED